MTAASGKQIVAVPTLPWMWPKAILIQPEEKSKAEMVQVDNVGPLNMTTTTCMRSTARNRAVVLLLFLSCLSLVSESHALLCSETTHPEPNRTILSVKGFVKVEW